MLIKYLIPFILFYCFSFQSFAQKTKDINNQTEKIDFTTIQSFDELKLKCNKSTSQSLIDLKQKLNNDEQAYKKAMTLYRDIEKQGNIILSDKEYATIKPLLPSASSFRNSNAESINYISISSLFN